MSQLLAGVLAGGVGAYGYLTDWSFKLNTNSSSFSKSASSINYENIREDIEEILPRPGYDDGSLGPLLVRLAWHASGTYDKDTKSGGSNGATMRFKPELSDGANAGLHLAQEYLQPIKQKYPQISHSDLWILASYVALEHMGAPRIPFNPGRKDAVHESACPPNGRLPDATKGAQHIRDVFGRMGFSDREMVCLIGGGHALGRCHKDRSGFDGPWTKMPTGLTNMFFKELLDNTWNVRKWDGPVQFEDKSKKLMMLPTDMELKNDKEFKRWCEVYKQDQNQFMSDFSDVFKKLTELGFTPSY